MKKLKNKFIPTLITVLILVVIIYLFASVKQPYIECSRKIKDNLGMIVDEELVVILDNNKIDKMTLTKRITLADKYLKDNDNIEQIKDQLIDSYNYLPNSNIKIATNTNYVLVSLEVSNNETLILNNITFSDDNGLKMKINPNTKSSDVLTLKVKDKYTQGELTKHMKNNGYTCK